MKQYITPTEEIMSLGELETLISKYDYVPKDYKVAVGSLIFDQNDKVILIQRGAASRDAQGELEGIGGALDDTEEDLKQSLIREIQEEVDVVVKIEKLLTILTLPGSKPGKFWVVPIYLCRLQDGEPKIMEPEKISKIHALQIINIPQDQLSRFQKATMQAYREKYQDKPYYQL